MICSWKKRPKQTLFILPKHLPLKDTLSRLDSHQSRSWGSRNGIPKRPNTSFSVGVASAVPACTLTLPWRTTFWFSECSERLMFFVFARALMERLKCAEPVKYMRAQASSLYGTTMMSSRRCRWPGPGSRHTPMYFFCSPFSSWLTRSSVRKPKKTDRQNSSKNRSNVWSPDAAVPLRIHRMTTRTVQIREANYQVEWPYWSIAD